VDLQREGANYAAAISCILPMAQVVYTGDEEGRVVSMLYGFVRSLTDFKQFEWDCVKHS